MLVYVSNIELIFNLLIKFRHQKSGFMIKDYLPWKGTYKRIILNVRYLIYLPL